MKKDAETVLERIHKKCARFLGSNGRLLKNLDCVLDSTICERSLVRKRRTHQRGVTLVELLVVLGIIALISAIVVVNVLPARDQAAVKKATIDVGVLSTALDQYRLDMLNYPEAEQGLAALVTLPGNARRAENYRPGGYLVSLPLDPWGSPYQYVIPGERGVYDLYSFGADGERGGEGFDADIGNWQEG